MAIPLAAAKASADFIDGRADVGNEVEAVVNNVCVRQPGLDGRLVRSRTVDTHRHDACTLRLGEFFEKRLQ